MNLYSARKWLYGVAGYGLAEATSWAGEYLMKTPVDNWLLKALLVGVGTAAIAGVRRKVFPGLWGAPN